MTAFHSQGEPVKPSPLRAAIARRMVESKREAPHFYVDAEIVADGALRVVERAESDSSVRVTVTAVIAWACAQTLRAHPRLNAVWTDRGLVQMNTVNLGIAIALDDGLLAPALLGAEALSIYETAAALRDLVERARSKRLRPEELADATFTLTNLGMFPISGFTAIIPPPQVAILASGAIVRRPVVVGDEIVARPVMSVAVSADHRALDGADVAAFLQDLKARLEDEGGLDG